MTTPTETKEFDPFESASNPPEPTYDLFGKIEINAWACALQKGVRGGVAFDPAVHEKRFTMIDMYIQPLPEIDVKFPKSLEYHEIAEFGHWPKFTLPSLKILGVENVREINNKWARVTRLGTNKFYDKKDLQGNPTGEKGEETTWKFVAFYASEDECRAAYLAAGGTPAGNGRNAPVAIAPTPEDAEKNTAYAFLKVIVQNAARGKTTWNDAKSAVAGALTQYPTVAKFYTADSVETGQLITEITKLLPF